MLKYTAMRMHAFINVQRGRTVKMTTNAMQACVCEQHVPMMVCASTPMPTSPPPHFIAAGQRNAPADACSKTTATVQQRSMVAQYCHDTGFPSQVRATLAICQAMSQPWRPSTGTVMKSIPVPERELKLQLMSTTSRRWACSTPPW